MSKYATIHLIYCFSSRVSAWRFKSYRWLKTVKQPTKCKAINVMESESDQNSLLVTPQLTYIHQGQRMRGLVLRSYQWCESRDAILRTFSRGYSRCRECIPISNSFRKETMPISISPSIWDLKWFWMMVSSVPKRGFKVINWYAGLTF